LQGRKVIIPSLKYIQERAVQIIFFICATVSAVIVLSIIYALAQEGYPIIAGWVLHGFGMLWMPNVDKFGVIPLIFLTFYAGIGCTVVATVLGLPCAIYLAEFADERIRNIVKPSLEVLTGFPSVILGLIGFGIVVTTIGIASGAGTGEGILAVWIVVGIMSIPTVASISEDSLRAVPRDLKEASLGLGATRWQTMVNVMVPVATPGILTSILLGMGNAVGETMAALMIIGGVSTPSLSFDLIRSTNLIPPIIASGAVGDFSYLPPLYAIGFLLFVIIAILNLMIRSFVKGGSNGLLTPRRTGRP
jgi:phosphate ABC transporter permease protein PstC